MNLIEKILAGYIAKCENGLVLLIQALMLCTVTVLLEYLTDCSIRVSQSGKDVPPLDLPLLSSCS